MAKLSRYVQKVFGENSGSNEVGVFGSFAESVIEYSKDPKEIQKLATYLSGWFGAVLGEKAPTIQDRNALDYLFSYQLSYLMQQGVAEYDPDTTYYENSLVMYGGLLYRSKIDDNIDDPTNTFNWVEYVSDAARMGAFKNWKQQISLSGLSTAPYNRQNMISVSAEGYIGVCSGSNLYFDEGGLAYIGKTPSLTSNIKGHVGAIVVDNGTEVPVDIVFVSGAAGANPYSISFNGADSWMNSATTIATAFECYAAAQGNGYFIIGMDGSRIIQTNGPSYPHQFTEVVVNAAADHDWTGVAYDEEYGRFWIAGNNNLGGFRNPSFAYSDDDGATWTEILIGTTPPLITAFQTVLTSGRVAIGNGMTVFSFAVDDGGPQTYIIMTEDNGANYTYTVIEDQYTNLVFADGVFVMSSMTKQKGLVTRDFNTIEYFATDKSGIFKGLVYKADEKRVYGCKSNEVHFSNAV